MGAIDAEEEVMLDREVARQLEKLNGFLDRFANVTIDELRGIRHQLREHEGRTMAAIDDLKTAISTEDNAIDALVAYVADLGKQLADALANDDTAALQSIADDVNAHVAELQAAVPASTPETPASPVDGNPVQAPATVPGDGGNVPTTDPLAGFPGTLPNVPSTPVDDSGTPATPDGSDGVPVTP